MKRFLPHTSLLLRAAGLFVVAILATTSLVLEAGAQDVENHVTQEVVAPPVSVEIVGGDSLSVDPGAVVTVVYRISAQTDSIRTVTPEFDIPQGWSIVFGTQDIELLDPNPVTRFVTYKVPENALSGVYEPEFRVHSAAGDELSGIRSKVNVHSLHDLSIVAGASPSFLAAGKSFDVPLSVANDGNARVEIILSAQDRRFTHIELESERITLDPGQFTDVMAHVTTDADADRSQRIVLRFDARMAGDADVSTYTSVAFDIVPVFARMRPKAANTPLSLSVETVGDESGVSPQASIHASGKLLGGEMRIAATVAQSPRRKLYGQEPRVTVQYARDDLSLTVGDHSTYTSPMTLTGERGVGMSAQIQKEAWSVKGSVQRSRTIIPVQERAAISGTWHRSETSDISANLLHRNEFYDGTLLTIRSLSRPFGPTSKLDLECGISSGNSLQDPSCMIQTVGSSKRISYQIRAQRASIDFPGTLAGTRMGSAYTSYRITDAWRAEQTTTVMRRDVGSGSTRNNLYSKVGVNYSARIAEGNLYATAHGIRSVSRYSLVEGTTERIQNTLRVSSGYQLRRKGLTASFERGNASSNSMASSGALTRFRLNGRYTLLANLHLNASFEHSQGNLSSSAADQTNRQFGFGTTVSFRSNLRASITGFRSVIKSHFEQQYTSLRTGVSKTFRSGKVLALQAQFNHNDGRQSLRTADYRLSFTTPLDIPFTGGHRAGDILNGRVVDHETGAPIADVLLFLGNDLAITDNQGRFRFAKPGQDIVFLRLDASTIGYDRTPVIPMPMEIGSPQFNGEELIIPISGTATIEGHIHVYRNRDTGANLLGAETEDLARTGSIGGAVVQVESESFRQRTRTSEGGAFAFSQLPPGLYTVSVIRSNTDANQRLEAESIKVLVEVGEVSILEFRVIPARKRIRMIKSSNLSLAPGSVLSEPDSETERTDRDPSPQPVDEDPTFDAPDSAEQESSETTSEAPTVQSGSAGWLGSLKRTARADAGTVTSTRDASVPPYYLVRGAPHPTPPHPAYPLLFVLCILFLLVDLDLILRSVLERRQKRIHVLQEPVWLGTARFAVLYGFAITAVTVFAGPLAGLSVSLALSGVSVALETRTTYRAILNVVLLQTVARHRNGSWMLLRNNVVQIQDVSLEKVRVKHLNGLESTIPTHRLHALSPLTRWKSSPLTAVDFQLSFSRMSNLRQIRSMLESVFSDFRIEGVENHVHIAFDDLDANWTVANVQLIAPAHDENIDVAVNMAEAEFMSAGILLRNQTKGASGGLSRVVLDPATVPSTEKSAPGTVAETEGPKMRLVKGDNTKAA